MIQANIQEASHSYLYTFKVFITIIAICLACFYLLSPILVPIIISLSLYALLTPVTQYLVRKNCNHSLAIVFVLLVLLMLSFIALGYILPRVFDQLLLLQTKLPAIMTLVENYLTLGSKKITDLFGVELDMSEIFISLVSQSTSLGNTIIIGTSDKLISIMISVLLIPFMTYFMLKDFRSLRNNLMNCLPNSSFELGWLIYYRVSSQLQIYTRGVLIQAMIMAIITTIGFSLIGIEIPVLLGVMTGLLNLVPYVGPLISIIIASVVVLGMSPFDPSLLYLGMLVIVTGQIIDNTIVIPAFIANAVDLHPILVILGIIIFGNIFGMVGIILAIPAIAAAKILFTNLYSDIYNSSQRYSLTSSNTHE